MTELIDDYRKEDGSWGKTKKEKGVLQQTFSYRRWNGIIVRCCGKYHYENEKSFKKYYADKGVFVEDRWLGRQGYQNFTNWHINQIGYGRQDYVLDKDILGGRYYGEQNCVLVPKSINLLMQQDKTSREFPRGVSKRGRKYTSTIAYEKEEFIEKHSSLESAIIGYGKLRNAVADKILQDIACGNIEIDPRVIPHIHNWKI